jgi:hypothetical protein
MRWMRQLVLVGVMLAAASAPAHDARTSFTVGAYVVEACELGVVAARTDARCAALASQALRGDVTVPAATAAITPRTPGARETQPSQAPRDAATDGGLRNARILLIRF